MAATKTLAPAAEAAIEADTLGRLVLAAAEEHGGLAARRPMTAATDRAR
jgi:hypothetical protein